MGLDEYLRPDVVQKRLATKKLMLESYTDLIPHINEATMPTWIIPKIKALGINGFQIKSCGGPGMTNLETGSIAYQLARYDASISTFVLVHSSIGSAVVDALGDEEQKTRILGECINMDKFICFGLTEPLYGSDATSMVTSAKKVEGGYLINGSKRWIGNATFADYIVIWARNEDEEGRI
jgi:glutaryl-CoA dehydrogenase